MVKPEVLDVLRRHAEATGSTVSANVGELLEVVSPVLNRVAELAEIAVRAQAEVGEGLKKNLQSAHDSLEPAMVRAFELLGIVPEGTAEELTKREPAARKLRRAS